LSLPSLPARSDARPWDVAVFGENSLDFVARLGDTPSFAGKQVLAGFDTFPGGQGATAAVGCARLGARVGYIGVFGADAWAETARVTLAREGVDLVAIERPDARSRVAVILVDPSGERSVYEHRDPGLTLDDPSRVVDAALRGRVVLVDGADIAASIAVARAARQSGAGTVVDLDRSGPQAVTLLREIDVIILPEALACALGQSSDLPRALEDIARQFAPMAVVATLGDRGSLAMVSGRIVSTAGFAVEVTDTTGAGDAFRAGFCAAWAAAGPETEVEALLEFANATAALNCRSVGAQTGLPTCAAVEDLVTKRAGQRSNS
jgi:sugar/nucleoside kinase (ribokinase family)